MTTKWCFVLCPNFNYLHYPDSVRLFLFCKTSKETGFEFSVKFKLGVHKDNGEDCFISDGSYSLFSREKYQPESSGEFYTFLKHKELFKEENGYVVGGKLVVYADFEVEAKQSSKIIRSSLPFADLMKMFEYEAFCDLQVKTSEDEVLKAHKVVLGARSPVFFAMLTADMEESKQGTVNVPDINSKVMKEVLRFIYCNEVEGLKEIATGLIYAAEKYQLEELKEICLQEITSSVQVGNAVELLNVAYQVSDAEYLFVNCLDLIANNYSEVSKGHSWKELPEVLMAQIREFIREQPNTLEI